MPVILTPSLPLIWTPAQDHRPLRNRFGSWWRLPRTKLAAWADIARPWLKWKSGHLLWHDGHLAKSCPSGGTSVPCSQCISGTTPSSVVMSVAGASAACCRNAIPADAQYTGDLPNGTFDLIQVSGNPCTFQFQQPFTYSGNQFGPTGMSPTCAGTPILPFSDSGSASYTVIFQSSQILVSISVPAPPPANTFGFVIPQTAPYDCIGTWAGTVPGITSGGCSNVIVASIIGPLSITVTAS